MGQDCFWLLCSSLSVVFVVVVVQGKQTAHLYPVPEILKVYADENDKQDFGAWKMNIEWRINFTSSNNPEKVTFDTEIFHTEQMRLVHNETIEVRPLMGVYQWSWTSPLPLQCTSHSVRLRFRDHRSHTSDWTPLYRLEGKDADENSENNVYPKDHVVRVGEGIIFCCILKPSFVAGFTSPDFTIQISNRTFATEPIYPSVTSPGNGFDVSCSDTGATYFVGYAPDDQNLTCETRDLSSVECHWSRGNIGDANLIKNVTYTINGRHCSFDSCILSESIDKGVMNWTLAAKNALGIKIISDLADPKHRVRLKAPVEVKAILVHAWNATIEWAWKETLKYDSFPMICQAEVNSRTVKTTFSGPGLQSLVLADLQPFSIYTARVRCGSSEHFYKWGDWSELVSFSTKEDAPEAMDVWMHVFNGETYVVWKNLNANQSHGTITGYELLLGRSMDKNKRHIIKSSNESCHKLRSVEKDNFISISAKNSAGNSSPSNITIPYLGSDSVEITNISNVDDAGLSVSWKPSPNSSCGYVVEWISAFSTQQCAVKWMKIQPGTTSSTIYSDFEAGVKYNFSIYVCTSGAPELLQRSQVYVKELPPSGTVRNLTASQIGSDIELSWEEMQEEDKRGILLGYIVSYEPSDVDLPREIMIKDPKHRLYRLNLHPGEYMFRVKAFTSVGAGPGFEIRTKITTNVQIYNLIFNILPILATAAFLIIIIFLCYIKRKWLKTKLYPDIPKPMLSESLRIKGHVIDKMLLSEREVLMLDTPEPCLQVVPQVQKECEEINLMSKDPLWPTYYNDLYESQTAAPITLDPFYVEVPSPGIQNPTYSVQLSLPAMANLVLGYIPQTEKCNNQSQTCEVTSVPVCSEGYQPQ